MLVVRPIGPDAGRYYADGPPGTWVGGGAEALGLQGRARAADVDALLHGRRPGTRDRLGDRPRRRAGWDLTFAAPKGVSLAAALLDGPADPGAALAGAHRDAVTESLGFACRHALWVRRGDGGGGRFVAAGDGLVAVRFEHASSAAGDPHLHSHVLLVNALLGPDGRWTAVATSPLWRSQREMGSLYELGLRHHVAARGLDAGWASAASGGRDLAGVPRPAVEAASRRQAEIADHQARGRPATGRAAARAVTRPGREGRPPADWRPMVAAAGLDRAVAAAAVTSGAAAAGPPPVQQVEAALEAQASSFTVRDVLRALDGAVPGGMAAADAEELAAQVCAGAEPVASRPGRWTTAAGRHVDRGVARLVEDRQGAGAAVVDGRRARRAAADPALDDRGRAAVARLLEAGHGVEVLAGTPGRDRLDAQAAVLDAARRAWQASGHRVATAGPGRRWEPLAGVGPASGWPDVLIVDRADGLAPPQLAGLLNGAAGAGTKVVLVEGGTLPARGRPRCEALEGAERLDPGGVAARPDRRGPLATAGALTVVAGGRDAVAHLADLAGREGALLVGAGRAEVEALNAAARSNHASAGDLTGPALTAGGRTWQAGERVIALRADRSNRVPAGARGEVAEVAAGRRPGLVVAWDGGGRTELPRHQAGLIGPGWATTPALAAAAEAPVACLGAPPRTGPVRDRLVEAVVVAPATVRDPQRHPELDAAVDRARSGDRTAPVVDPDRPLADLLAEHDRLGRALTSGLGGSGRPEDLLRWEALGDAIEASQDVAAHARDRSLQRPREPAPDLGPGLGL